MVSSSQSTKEERTMTKLLEGPVWEHDCTGCEYLGTVESNYCMVDKTKTRLFDVYECPNADLEGTIVSRYSDEPSENMTNSMRDKAKLLDPTTTGGRMDDDGKVHIVEDFYKDHPYRILEESAIAERVSTLEEAEWFDQQSPECQDRIEEQEIFQDKVDMYRNEY